MQRVIESVIRTARHRCRELDAFLAGDAPVLTPTPLRQDRARLMWQSVWQWTRRAEQVVGYYDRDRADGGPGVIGLFAPWAKIDGYSVATLLPRREEWLTRQCNLGFTDIIRPTESDHETLLWDDPVTAWPAMSEAANIAFRTVVHSSVAVKQMVADALKPLVGMIAVHAVDTTMVELLSACTGTCDEHSQAYSSHWLTKREVADRLNSSQRQVDRMAASGLITKYKLGSSSRSAVRFEASEIDRFMKKAPSQ